MLCTRHECIEGAGWSLEQLRVQKGLPLLQGRESSADEAAMGVQIRSPASQQCTTSSLQVLPLLEVLRDTVAELAAAVDGRVLVALTRGTASVAAVPPCASGCITTSLMDGH